DVFESDARISMQERRHDGATALVGNSAHDEHAPEAGGGGDADAEKRAAGCCIGGCAKTDFLCRTTFVRILLSALLSPQYCGEREVELFVFLQHQVAPRAVYADLLDNAWMHVRIVLPKNAAMQAQSLLLSDNDHIDGGDDSENADTLQERIACVGDNGRIS